jgi:hypothetical protein
VNCDCLEAPQPACHAWQDPGAAVNKLRCILFGCILLLEVARLQAAPYQQTLNRSFTVAGTGLHTAEYGATLQDTLYTLAHWTTVYCIVHAASWHAACRLHALCVVAEDHTA